MSAPHPPTGFVLRDPEESLGRQVAIVLVVLPIAVVILSFIAGVGWGLTLGAVALAVAFLVGKDALVASLAWHPPQLQVATSAYALGSTPVVTYRRRPKRPIDVGSFRVECKLMCEEEVTYTRGSDTSTDTRTVYEQNCNGTGEGTATGLAAELELPITAHIGAPSMHLPHNKIRWSVRIEVHGPRLPEDAHTFAIEVGPTLDSVHRHGVQDT